MDSFFRFAREFWRTHCAGRRIVIAVLLGSIAAVASVPLGVVMNTVLRTHGPFWSGAKSPSAYRDGRYMVKAEQTTWASWRTSHKVQVGRLSGKLPVPMEARSFERTLLQQEGDPAKVGNCEIQYAFGFPFPAAQQVSLYYARRAGAGRAPSPTLYTELQSVGATYGERGSELRLPGQVLWLGLVGNALIWSSFFCLTMVVVPSLRAWSYLRRGRCCSCGYSTEGLTGQQCPECGQISAFPVMA